MSKKPTPPVPEFVTLQRSAKISGLDEQEILDLAALAKLQAGVIVPNLRGHAIPRHGFSESSVSDGKFQAHKFVATRYRVATEHGEKHIVDVFIVSNFWVIGDLVKRLALTDEPQETNVLWPHKGANLDELKQFMPWPEVRVFLEEPFIVSRQSLRFVRAEIEALANDGRNQPEHKPGSWQEEAFKIANELDPDHKEPHMGAFSMQIHEKLKTAGVLNRYNKTPPVVTIERDVLRGWNTANK